MLITKTLPDSNTNDVASKNSCYSTNYTLIWQYMIMKQHTISMIVPLLIYSVNLNKKKKSYKEKGI